MNPIASFIVPVYNEENYIRKCLDSLIVQTETNFEIIVVDDGSTDGTSKILSSYNDPRIYIHRQKNLGRVVARNKALELSRGKYIILQDADDWSEPDRLENQLELAENCTGIPVVGTAIMFHDKAKNKLFKKKFAENNKDIRRIMGRIIFRQGFHPPSMLAPLKKIIEAHGWRSKFKIAGEDGDLISRLFEDEEVIFYNTSKPLYNYRHNYGSITNKLSVTIPQQIFMRYCERARRKKHAEPKSFEEYKSVINNSAYRKAKYFLEYLSRCLYSLLRWRINLVR
jgi:glycosyltransferase involved in cell wall biosynthesis